MLRVIQRFDIVAKPGTHNPDMVENWTVAPNDSGTFALFEFAGALPRAKLFTDWSINTNDQATLQADYRPVFDPSQTVLVAGGLPAASAASGMDRSIGSAIFSNYASRDIVLKCDAPSSSVLLLNDRFDPNWQVFVDGSRKPLLRCNFIMRAGFISRQVCTQWNFVSGHLSVCSMLAHRRLSLVCCS